MKRLLLIVLMLLFCTSANAFDGDRKGFVFGGGWGFTRFTESNDIKNGYNWNLVIGYGVNQKNTLIREMFVNYYDRGDLRFGYAYGTLAWNHYFSNSKKNSIYTTLGIRKLFKWNIVLGIGYSIRTNFEIGFHYLEFFESVYANDLKFIIRFVGF